jgi:hypothetical protein
VAGDQADVGGVDLEGGGHRTVGLGRGLVASHSLIDAEPALEYVDNAGVL